MPDWVPDWLKFVIGLFAICAGLYLVVKVVVSFVIRPFWKTAVMSAKHHELPIFIGQFLVVLVAGVIGYLYFLAPRSSTGVVPISVEEIARGVGVASILVGVFLKAKQRSWEADDKAKERSLEANDILATAAFDDGRCAWCGLGVDGKRVSHEEYQRLWQDEDEQFRIRGHLCESCNSLSCFSCREAAVGWVETSGAGQWESAQKASCTKCRTGRKLKLIVEPASIHAGDSPNRILKL
jgi:hypothetical protein